MSAVTSADGTLIDHEACGDGPAVIFIAGAVQHRAIDPATDAAAHLLAQHGLTGIVYDRRGRGRSGDRAPWSLAREVEDVAALIAAAGGEATLCSSSSGATIALEAALTTSGVSALVLYEPPFFHGGDKATQIATIAQLLAEGDDDGAMRYDLTDVVGLPGEVVAGMARGPAWAAMCAVAPTLIYDLTALSDISADPDWHARWIDVAVPVTVASGAASSPALGGASDEVAAAIPGARREVLPGQGHSPSGEALADLVVRVHAGRDV